MSSPPSEEVALADACAFLRAGGTIGLDRWGAMGPASKRLYGLAAEVVERERAQRLAEAIVHALREPSAPVTVPVATATPTQRMPWSDEHAAEILQAFGPVPGGDGRAERNAELRDAAAGVLRDVVGGAP